MERTCIVLSFFLLLLINGKIDAQDTTSTVYVDGDKANPEIINHLDSVHRFYKGDLAGLTGGYDFFVALEIDTNGSVASFALHEIPLTTIPQTVKTYAEKLIKIAIKRWKTARSGKDPALQRFFCRFSIISNKQTPEEKYEDGLKYSKYLFSDNGSYKEFYRIVERTKTFVIMTF